MVSLKSVGGVSPGETVSTSALVGSGRSASESIGLPKMVNVCRAPTLSENINPDPVSSRSSVPSMSMLTCCGPVMVMYAFPPLTDALARWAGRGIASAMVASPCSFWTSSSTVT